MVYVIPFAPAWDAKDRERIWLVSEEGGDEPRWSREGDELFFVTDTGFLCATQIDASSDTFTYTKPQPLFASPWSVRRRGYDPTPDHEDSPNGFMFMGSVEAREAPISLLLNWPALVGEGE